jgi:hypothetical protein
MGNVPARAYVVVGWEASEHLLRGVGSLQVPHHLLTLPVKEVRLSLSTLFPQHRKLAENVRMIDAHLAGQKYGSFDASATKALKLAIRDASCLPADFDR